MGSFWWWDSERSSSIQGFWPLSAKKKHSGYWWGSPWPWGIDNNMFDHASMLQLGTGTSLLDLVIRSQTSYDFAKHCVEGWSINTLHLSSIPQPSLGLSMFERLISMGVHFLSQKCGKPHKNHQKKEKHSLSQPTGQTQAARMIQAPQQRTPTAVAGTNDIMLGKKS